VRKWTLGMAGAAALGLLSAGGGCATAPIRPVKVEVHPIAAGTPDVGNPIRQIDQALEAYFGPLDVPDTAAPPPASDRAAFRERQPRLHALQDAGLIGENTAGFVEFVGAVRKDEAAVEEENAARRNVYERIAADTGTSSDRVGQRRAVHIAHRAPAGHLIQNEKGEWRRKL
jgi:uncharacterized protein